MADPNTTSDTDRMQQATMLKQAAMATPGYDMEQVERRFLKAMKIDNIDIIYPGPKKVPPGENLKITIEKMRLQGQQMQLQAAQQEFVLGLMEERRLNDAKIEELHAKSASLIAQIGADRAAMQLEAFNGIIEMVKQRNDLIGKQLDIRKKQMELTNVEREQNADGAGMGGVAGSPSDQVPSEVGEPAAAGATGTMG